MLQEMPVMSSGGGGSVAPCFVFSADTGGVIHVTLFLSCIESNPTVYSGTYPNTPDINYDSDYMKVEETASALGYTNAKLTFKKGGTLYCPIDSSSQHYSASDVLNVDYYNYSKYRSFYILFD